MNRNEKRPNADVALSDAAIDWLVKLHSGRATDGDRAAFTAWRRQSDGHELAAREAEAIWQGVGIAGREVREAGQTAERTVTRRAVLGGGVAVAGGLALAGYGLVGPRLLADHATGTAEQRMVTLPDGSTAHLNAGTALDVNFGDRERRLALLEGEALFTVMPDAARPFVVEAGGGRTRAVGTVFDVDIRSEEVVVTVVEGAVDVATDAQPAMSVAAEAGHRVRYVADAAASPPEPVDADVETAWRRGKLIFNRRPLGDVAAQVERYRSGRIVIASDRLRRLEVTGVFDLSDPEAILAAIEETLPVRMTRLPFLTVLR